MEEGRSDVQLCVRCLVKRGNWTKNDITCQQDTSGGDDR